jgi:hypothetical protein
MEAYWKLNPDVVFVIPTVAMSINHEKGLWVMSVVLVAGRRLLVQPPSRTTLILPSKRSSLIVWV